MVQRLIQPSFARGEIGPDLYGRVDVAAYKVALRTALNVIIHAYGGASNRPGLLFNGPCMSSSYVSRLIEFKYNTDDTYIVEMGDKKARFLRNDAHVLQAAKAISTILKANPAVVTANAHGYSNGDDVYIQGCGGMWQVNNRWFKIANATADTFSLKNQQTGEDIDASAYAAYSEGGTVARVYEIVTPYEVADLEQLTYVQSANVMTLTHRKYHPKELSRLAHDNWTLADVSFAPTQAAPTNLALSVGSAGAVTYKYKVTATNRETQEESLAATVGAAIAGITATAANPVVCTKNAHGIAEGEEIYLTGFTEMTQLNGRRFSAINVTTNTFVLYEEDGSSYVAETTGGSAYRTVVTTSLSAEACKNTVSVSVVDGAGSYSFYRQDVSGTFGFIGSSETGSFLDDYITPNSDISPPKYRNPFYGERKHPGAVTYYEQRRVFADQLAKPDTLYYSATGSASNMTFSSPMQDSDAITATLNARQVNEIRGFIPGNDLLVFTSGAEWKVNSGSEASFSAKTLRQKPQSYWGSSWRQPIIVGDKMLFVTENESYVRSLGYEITIDGYKGSDMTIFAPHLFRHYTLKDWAVSLSPDPQITCIRSDGYACNLTFNPDQEVIAWSRWNTQGKFKAVASTRPNAASVDTMPYFVVQRVIDGHTVNYIERLASRRFADVRDAFFVDCGLSYDEPVEITGITLGNPTVIHAAGHGFQNGDEVDFFDILWEPTYDEVFNEEQPEQLNRLRYVVANVTADTFELVGEDSTGFAAYVSGGTARKAVSTIYGAWHLEGKEIVVLADGNVISGITVHNGSFTLPRKYSRVHAGLRYITDIETLDPEKGNGTLQGKHVRTPQVVVRFRDSRGLLIGPDAYNLREMKQRDAENLGEPTHLLTGDKKMAVTATWRGGGRQYLRQIYPLPLTVLAIMSDVDEGDDGQ